jgi:hypothetical protein
MIKFFRKIRQNLLMENLPTGQAGKTRKYFKYAIGEIVLVVIGILIALSINNWNDIRINHLKEDNYLVNLKRDLNSQQEIIDRNLKGEKHIFNSLTKAANNYKKYKRFRAVKEDLVLISTLNDRWSFTVTCPTYTDLLSTGNLDLITNADLKDFKIKYYEDLEQQSGLLGKFDSFGDYVRSLITPNCAFLMTDAIPL